MPLREERYGGTDYRGAFAAAPERVGGAMITKTLLVVKTFRCYDAMKSS